MTAPAKSILAQAESGKVRVVFLNGDRPGGIVDMRREKWLALLEGIRARTSGEFRIVLSDGEGAGQAKVVESDKDGVK